MTDMQEHKVIRKSLATRMGQWLLLLLGPVVIVAISGWVYLQGGRYISTDNAYIKTEILSISANVTGMVMEVFVRENETVAPGQLLLRVDDQPYIIAVARAEANLSNVHGEIESLKAEFVNTGLEREKAQTDLDYRRHELERLRRLFEQDSLSEVQFEQALYASNSAERELAEKSQALQVVKARLIDPKLPTEAHPRMKLAMAELEKAQLDLSHTEVRAPKAGVLANITTSVGENVVTGAPLMSLIDNNLIWLTANFKETDLTYMRVGQPVTITVDTYPDRGWQGHVEVITPATGAEFALLPAQNSSGNWIKVVQRIPVILLFDDYTGDPLLASGMSAEVSVDTGHKRSLPSLSNL
jgi:membrane fusion protein (multidrug efflux system)